MSSTNSSSPVSILLPNFAILLLVAMGLFGNRDALISARPTSSAATREFKYMRVRSWEDPLTIPRPSGGAAGVVMDENGCTNHITRTLNRAKLEMAKFRAERGYTPKPLQVLVLPVLLPNDARDDEGEIRLRIRYAVSAALGRAQYVAMRNDRMVVGNLSLPIEKNSSRTADLTVRAEFFELRHIVADNVVMKPHPHYWAGDVHDAGATHPDSAPLIFERPYDLVSVIWLDESQLSWQPTPLAQIEEAAGRLFCEVQGYDLKVIGPNDSDLLAGWLTLDGSEVPLDPPEPRRVLLSPRATASDAVLKISISTDPELAGKDLSMKEGNWSLERTIATDDVLVRALIRELQLRAALPADKERALAATAASSSSPAPKLNPIMAFIARIGAALTRPVRALLPGQPHIAIIAEWNTLYARSMARTFSAVLQPGGAGSPSLSVQRMDWSLTPRSRSTGGSYVHEFSYLRGLDGALGSGDRSGENARDERRDGGAEPGRALALRGAQGLNTAAGTSQLDYLRRLEAELHQLDRRLRLKGDRLSAIGILGSDVYDKLLILRALKKSFPQAIFFTTDIDANYLDRNEAEFARNLVIASAHGLKTSGALQYGVPPFRDSYQTALYLTTLRALGLNHVGREPFSPAQPAALVAEVGVTRLNLLARYESGRMVRLAYPDREAVQRGWAEIHPSAMAGWWASPRRKVLLGLIGLGLAGGIAAMLPRYRRVVVTVVWLLAAAGICAVLVAVKPHIRLLPDQTVAPLFYGFGTACALVALGMFYKLISPEKTAWRGRIWTWANRIGIGLCVVFVLLSVVAWLTAASSLSNRAEEEPFFLSEGISVWPAVLVRAITLVWCVWSLFHAQRMLDHVGDALDHHATGVTVHPFTDAQMPAWQRYCERTRGAARTRRVIAYILGLTVVAIVVGFATGQPVVPARGLMSRAVETGILLVSTFAYLNLLFHVIDSIQTCRLFIEDLDTGVGREAGRSEAEFIEMVDLLASRIGRLVYLPFTAIFMLIAARNPMFDAWDWPIVLMLVFAFGLGLLIWSYLALLSSARRARAQALEYVQHKLLFSVPPWESPAADAPTGAVPAATAAERTAGDERIMRSPVSGETGGTLAAEAATRAGAAARPKALLHERPEYWKARLEKIRSLDGLIYRPWYQSPLLGAILIPIGGSGSIKLLEQVLRGV